MRERKIPLALFHNPTGSAVEVSIVERVGVAPDVYRAEAGGVVEGPANYADTFARYRLVPVTKERLVELEAQAKAKADAQAKADAEAKAKVEADAKAKAEAEAKAKVADGAKKKG